MATNCPGLCTAPAAYCQAVLPPSRPPVQFVPTLIAAYAALLALCGGALLFAPSEVGALVSGREVGTPVLVQLLGAALLGFAAADWVARRSVLGGIYGRAVVAGNLAFAFIGALTLLGSVPAEPGVAFWLLLVVLVAGTATFGWLLFRGPRLGSTGPGR